MSGSRPTERFSDRVDDYVRYRPGYPREILATICDVLSVAPPAQVADIGAGTGIFSALLLDAGYRVTAVEPNQAMRDAAERTLSSRPGFSIVAGTAEATGLPDASCDLVTAAQAFHWFDPPRARVELMRITRPPHPVALVWNTRSLDATPFLRAYDALLLRVSDDYAKVRHQNIGPESLAAFFGNRGYERRVFPSEQVFDEAAFLGRAFSSSYVPGKGHPRHAETDAALRALFAEHATSAALRPQGAPHAQNGSVAFVYDTEIFLGYLGDA